MESARRLGMSNPTCQGESASVTTRRVPQARLRRRQSIGTIRNEPETTQPRGFCDGIRQESYFLPRENRLLDRCPRILIALTLQGLTTTKLFSRKLYAPKLKQTPCAQVVAGEEFSVNPYRKLTTSVDNSRNLVYTEQKEVWSG
jgi:hypothetical protein